MFKLFKNLRGSPKEIGSLSSVREPVFLRGRRHRLPIPSSLQSTPFVLDEAHVHLLVDVITNLWRVRSQLLQPGTDRPREEMRRAYRPFEAAWNALTQANIEVFDHTGNPFHSGLLLRVLAFQPTPDLDQETVIETLRPTIYYKKHLLQPGEVIVGTPENLE